MASMRAITILPGLLLLLICPHCDGWSSLFLSPIAIARTRGNSVSMKSSTEDLTRRQWLRKGIASAVVGGAACIATSAPPSLAEVPSPWGPEGDPKAASSWFPLLDKCYRALEDVIENWDKIAAREDGDAIRRLIGTVGVSSPLSSLRRAFVSIRDAEEESQGDIDVIGFVEAYMEVLTALGDAENDLYSANFADYAGGGGMKGSQFIAKARKSLVIARANFKVVKSILQI